MNMVRSYAKGYAAERELLHTLSRMGYMVMRSPRSGRIGVPNPDIVAIKGGRVIVIECKSRAAAFSVPQEQIEQLREWEHNAGAVPYVGWKISRKGWRFIRLDDVAANNGNVGKKFAGEKGVGIGEL